MTKKKKSRGREFQGEGEEEGMLAIRFGDISLRIREGGRRKIWKRRLKGVLGGKKDLETIRKSWRQVSAVQKEKVGEERREPKKKTHFIRGEFHPLSVERGEMKAIGKRALGRNRSKAAKWLSKKERSRREL